MPRKGTSAKSSNTGTRALHKLQQLDVDAADAAQNEQQQPSTKLFENDSQILRQSISSLFRAGSTLRSYRFASRKIEPNLGSEQLWSQLQILYAPTLKRVEGAFESTQNFDTLAQKLQESEQKAKTDSRTSNNKIRSKKASLEEERRRRYGGGDDDEDDDEDDDVNLFSSRQQQKKKNIKLPGDLAELDAEEQDRIRRKKLAKQQGGAGFDGTSRVGNYAFGMGSSTKSGKKVGGNDDDDVDNALLDEEFGAGIDDDRDNNADGNEAGGSLFSSNSLAGARKKKRQNSFDRYDNDEAEYDADDLLDDDADDEELLRRAKRALKQDGAAGDDDDEDVDDEEGEEDDFDYDDEEEGDEEDFVDEEDEENKAMKEMYGTFDADEFEAGGDQDGADGEDDAEFSKFKQSYDEQESLEDEEDRKIDSEEIRKKPETAFEAAEQERQARIQKAEQDRLAGNWEMKGEAAAVDRPRDALLETDLIMEHAMPTAPIITESITLKLEERLKRRILANNFDDVIRKNPKLVHFDEKDAKILAREKMDEQAQKSKSSLVDLYEKEYLEKQRKAGGAEEGEQAEPLSQVEQDELKVLQQWRRISQHLDALSNFFFTPKPAANDLDARVRAVQDQAPAISVESKGMFALSKEKVLAPQDVFRPKKGQAAAMTVSKDEMTPAEKRGVRSAQKRSFQVAEDLKDKRKGEREKKKKSEKDSAVSQD